MQPDASARGGARRHAAGHAAIAATAIAVAACAVVFAGGAARGSRGFAQKIELDGLNIAALEAQAASALPGGKARTQGLADADALLPSAPPSLRKGAVYGNDASGDEVELDPISSSSSSSGARTQALYDTAGVNAAAGGLITTMQRATVGLTFAFVL